MVVSQPGRPRLAVIDDDASFREAMTELLASLGLAADVFDSAEGFLATADPAAYACLLVDLHMPGMNGLELLAALAARGGAPPSIMMTASNVPPNIERALAAGALGVLGKPPPFREMRALLRRALGADALE
jgi:two-component system CheB/CheR fusion protein